MQNRQPDDNWSKSPGCPRCVRHYDWRVQSPDLLIIGVATPYAWDVVESARRASRDFACIDNVGGADARLPSLAILDDGVDRSTPFTLGVSSAAARLVAAHSLFGLGFRTPVALVDPTATLASTSAVGHGVYVNAGVVVASNTRIACHVNINRSSSIGHDNSIGFAASIAPGATLAGTVTVGAAASIGTGAVVLPGLTIGTGAVVGAGAVVTRSVPDWHVVVGNPARVIRALEPQEGSLECPHC